MGHSDVRYPALFRESGHDFLLASIDPVEASAVRAHQNEAAVQELQGEQLEAVGQVAADDLPAQDLDAKSDDVLHREASLVGAVGPEATLR